MTPEDRVLAKQLIDEARRKRVGEKATPLQRKIEKAHRAQQAPEIVALVLPAAPRVSGHCGYCGARTDGIVCRAHADLLQGVGA